MFSASIDIDQSFETALGSFELLVLIDGIERVIYKFMIDEQSTHVEVIFEGRNGCTIKGWPRARLVVNDAGFDL